MALTQPFINSISAFDATQSNILTLNVLGGDIITSYQFWIYLQEDSSLVYTSPTLTPTSTDVATEDIRTFNLPIPANTCTNNNTYYIVAQTFNPDLTDYTSSPFSAQSLFVCYLQPSFDVFVSISDVYEDITTLTPPQILASNVELKLVFDTNDTSSPAILNEANIQLFGIDSQGNSNLLFESETLYNAPLIQTVTGFLPTLTSGGLPDTSAIYSSYTLSITGKTIDNFDWTQNITDLQCYYNTSSSSLNFEVTNLCDEGTIKILSNIPFYDTSINYLTIEYKEASSTNGWITIQTINRNLTTSIFANFNFYFYFPYCANNKVYDFRMTLFGDDGSQINSYTQTVVSTFYKSYIADTTKIYPLYESWKRSNTQTIQKSAIYEPYGSVYPFVAYNALTQYKKGTETAILLAPTSKQMTSSYIDRMAQVMLENEFNAWLTNRQGKILKTVNGDIRIVSVYNPISNEYFSELGNGIASTSFDWVEISDFTQTNLNKNGMINRFNVNYFSIPSFAEASWEDIKIVAQADAASDFGWEVGDIKNVIINDVGYNVRIADTQTGRYEYSDSSRSSNMAFEFVEILPPSSPIMIGGGTTGGWAASDMRTITMATILSNLPTDLQAVIAEVNVASAIGDGSSTISTSANKLFLPCAQELYGDAGLDIEYYPDEGTQLDYYVGSTDASKIKYLVDIAQTYASRSPRKDSFYSFVGITADGGCTPISPSINYYASVFFAI
jgi:hypothetical protein